MAWSYDDEQTLKRLWNKEKLSASEIAAAMPHKGGRNAILGKVRRLNLDPRVDPDLGTVAFRVRDILALKISDVELNESRTVESCGQEMNLAPDRAAAVWDRIVQSLGWQADEHGLDDDGGNRITRKV